MFKYRHPVDYPCPVCLAKVDRRCRDKKGRVIHYHRKRLPKR